MVPNLEFLANENEWMLRFRGMISTQPGSTSLSSFKIVSLEEEIPKSNPGNDIGPFGDQDDEQVRIQLLFS